MKTNKKRFGGFFDSHHAIDRYTVMLAFSVVCIAGGYVYSQADFNHQAYVQMMTVDQDGASATFSQSTNTSVTLGETQLSTDEKTAYIPLTFNSLDQVGIKANNYKIYVGDASNKSMKNRVSGRLILYASNSRAVLVLNSTTKIANQPLVLFLMNDKKVTTLDGGTPSSNDNAVSTTNGSFNTNFGDYDVAPFKINPGAYDVYKHNKLSIDPTDMQAVYENVYGSKDIKVINQTVQNDAQQIKQYQKAASNLVERLEAAGYSLPTPPKWLDDDWRPYDAVNTKTGETANGKNLSKHDVTQDTDKDLASYNFPQTLRSKSGTATANNSSSSVSADGGSNAASIGGNTTDPNTQWSNLQTAWTQIENLKRDMYVTQAAKIYQIRQQESGVLSQATISANSRFKQISPVKD